MLERCPICPAKFCPIPFSGPQPCSSLWLGERPGEDENRRQTPFVGKTGEELDGLYLPLAGLRRSDVRVGNAVRCWATANRTPTRKEVLGCAGHWLPRELEKTQPEVLVLMGVSACVLMDQPQKLDSAHGYPRKGSILGGLWSGWIVQMYHPARGLHDTPWMQQLIEDFQRFKDWRAGRWVSPSGGERWRWLPEKVDYKVVQSRLEYTYPELPYYSYLPVDTERHGRGPYSIQFSTRPGQAYLIRADNKRAVQLFNDWLQDWHDGDVLLHNSPGDLDLLERVGVHVNHWRDTMQEAYHLGNLPQGLKPLSYRLLGVEMTSWEDTVWPASISAVREWLEDVAVTARSDLSDYKRKKGRGKGTAHVRLPLPGAVEKIALHVLKHMALDEIAEEEKKPYDPWEKWKEFTVEGLRGLKPEAWELEYVEGVCGRMPILGIGNCTAEEAVAYACGDADMTGRIATELERLRSGAFEVAEEDVDA
jgi:uracil-DNA glycosylase family 4